ncbi:unnamed protein product [Pleuronectes platessa]|uniref:Uncharacterized protein n=1 Tax=Pleuronectes platessa TaxID=8262 RepID=A0A9N7UDY9_PLEPL|nr:unnamed protein product [Pleuronectes platessa]
MEIVDSGIQNWYHPCSRAPLDLKCVCVPGVAALPGVVLAPGSTRSQHQLQERPPQWQAKELSESGGVPVTPNFGTLPSLRAPASTVFKEAREPPSSGPVPEQADTREHIKLRNVISKTGFMGSTLGTLQEYEPAPVVTPSSLYSCRVVCERTDDRGVRMSGFGEFESVSVRLCWREEAAAVVVVVVVVVVVAVVRGLLGPVASSHHHHHHHHSPFCLPQKYLYNTSGSKGSPLSLLQQKEQRERRE